MKYDKSLEEVWKWKAELHEETKGMTSKEKIAHINKLAKVYSRENNLRLKKAKNPAITTK